MKTHTGIYWHTSIVDALLSPHVSHRIHLLLTAARRCSFTPSRYAPPAVPSSHISSTLNTTNIYLFRFCKPLCTEGGIYRVLATPGCRGSSHRVASLTELLLCSISSHSVCPKGSNIQAKPVIMHPPLQFTARPTMGQQI